jgi:hypothetical protein
VGLNLTGPYQPLVYADAANLFGDNIHTYNAEERQVLLDNSKKTGLEVNTEKKPPECRVKS